MRDKKYRRVMIAAPKSGSGKTTITCALLQALKDRGEKAASFKCGPDYIDPMFHEKVIGVPSKNLDTFFTGEEQTRRLFLNAAPQDGIAVLEGVMGIYDGLGGVREEGSSYHLAKVTKTPVILVIDAKGMGRSVIPLIAGFLAYDKARLIRGVILNRMSKGYFEMLAPLIEEELGIEALGFLPERKDIMIESRHLGLMMPDEVKGLQERLQMMAKELVKTVSLEAVMKIAEEAEKPGKTENSEEAGKLAETDNKKGKQGFAREAAKPVIAVAKDEAFCFYYADNIHLLEEYGAEIRYFSPLHDRELPDCHGLLLGGGYPELYAGKLSENDTMRQSIKRAVGEGLPIVAECGGFMYLHDSLTDKDGISYAMAGVVPGSCFYTGKLVRFGYIELREKRNYFLPESEKIRGHEFHYFDSTDNGAGAAAIKPVTGREYSCILTGESCWMGFPHLYYPSNPIFARKFVEKAEYQMLYKSSQIR